MPPAAQENTSVLKVPGSFLLAMVGKKNALREGRIKSYSFPILHGEVGKKKWFVAKATVDALERSSSAFYANALVKATIDALRDRDNEAEGYVVFGPGQVNFTGSSQFEIFRRMHADEKRIEDFLNVRRGSKRWIFLNSGFNFFTEEVPGCHLLIGGYAKKIGASGEVKGAIKNREESVEKIHKCHGEISPDPSPALATDAESLHPTSQFLKVNRDIFGKEVCRFYGSFERAVLTLLQQVSCHALSKESAGLNNALFSIHRGNYVGVILVPPTIRSGLRSIGILVELSKQIYNGRFRAGCVRLSVKRNADFEGILLESDLHVSCSCWLDLTGENCVHVEAVCRKRTIIACVLSLLGQNFTGILTGSMIHEEEWKCIPCFPLVSGQRAYWISILQCPTSMLLPSIIPISESRASSRLSLPLELRIRCLHCRRAPGNRGICDHEISLIEADREMRNRKNDENNVFLPSEMAQDIEDENMDRQEEGQYFEEERFVAQRKRSFLPCPSDQRETKAMFDSIRTAATGCTEGTTLEVRICDKALQCRKCGFKQKVADGKLCCAVSYRNVKLHTLMQGTLEIFVVDYICDNCCAENVFDGADVGLFAASSKSVFAREILDFWLYHVAGLGGTFRQAYELSKIVSRNASVSNTLLGGPLSCNRRAANSCFSKYLKTLVAPSESALTSVFSCKTCEEVLPDKSVRMKGIVLDGTATGILGTLPSFQRQSWGIFPAKKCAGLQYVIQSPTLRKFLDVLFKSAVKQPRKDIFGIKLPRSVLKDKEWIMKSFFDECQVDEPHFVISELLKCSFAPVNSMTSDSSKEGNSAKPEEKGRESETEMCTAAFRHLLPSLDLRICLSDFGLCYATSSIPGTILCSEESISSNLALAESLHQIYACNHPCKLEATSGTSMACNRCSVSLQSAAANCYGLVPSAARLGSSVAKACIQNSLARHGTELRTVARAAAAVLDESVQVKREFNLRFESGQTAKGREYTSLHRMPSVMDCDGGPDKTGELFPGRPICRPRVSFDNIRSHPEATRDECTKNYRNSMSHSPGLFTVQCVCSNPKLLGVSVMESCESLSTAMSIILNRFAVLPKTIFYDNSCNLTKSIVLRFPWVLEESRIVCDRFHYKSHTCSSAYDPDSYPFLDNHQTSSAESINSRWASARSHIRFLNSENLMPFIMAKSVFMNLRSMLRHRKGIRDTEDFDLVEFGNSVMKCRCERCLNSCALN